MSQIGKMTMAMTFMHEGVGVDPRDLINKDVTIQSLKKISGKRLAEMVYSGIKQRARKAMKSGQASGLVEAQTKKQVRDISRKVTRRGKKFGEAFDRRSDDLVTFPTVN